MESTFPFCLYQPYKTGLILWVHKGRLVKDTREKILSFLDDVLDLAYFDLVGGNWIYIDAACITIFVADPIGGESDSSCEADCAFKEPEPDQVGWFRAAARSFGEIPELARGQYVCINGLHQPAYVRK